MQSEINKIRSAQTIDEMISSMIILIDNMKEGEIIILDDIVVAERKSKILIEICKHLIEEGYQISLNSAYTKIKLNSHNKIKHNVNSNT